MGVVKLKAVRALFASIVLSAAFCGCDKDEECAKRTCSRSADPKPTALLDLDVQVSGGWDSVWVELHSGSAVENSPLYTSWSGSGTRTFLVSEGSWSAHAVYIRPGDTLDTYDADETSWSEQTDECGCFERWESNDGKLDLRAR